MLRVVKIALAVNLILGLLFLYSSLSLMGSVNSEYPSLTVSHWSPFFITCSHYYFNSDGTYAIAQGIWQYLNSPFWVFWTMLLANLYFILKIGKTKAKQE